MANLAHSFTHCENDLESLNIDTKEGFRLDVEADSLVC